MGTGGYRIIKFRGRYWVFSNSYDSYPKGLGKSLVDRIPKDPKGYQKWLQDERASFAKWDALLQEFLTVQPEDLAALRSPQSEEDSQEPWHIAFDERLEYIPPSHHCDYGDEWVYIIDLDLEVISVDHGAHFRLDRVSHQNDQWMQALAFDRDSNRLALPQYIDEDCVASLTVKPEDFALNACQYWKTLNTRVVTPNRARIESTQPTVNRLRRLCFDSFDFNENWSLTVALLGWTAKAMPFREIVYFMICLAAGGENLSIVDKRRVYEKNGLAGINMGSKVDDEMELASSLGVGYHKPELPMGSAPEETKYWFEGALVSLVPRLNRPGIMEKAIGDVIQYGRKDCGQTAFNAVLISIEHLVLVKSFQDGTVDHTEILPFIELAPHRSMDARERYGSAYVDELYEAVVTEQNDETEGGDGDPSVQISAPTTSSHDGSPDTVKQEISTFEEDGSDRKSVGADAMVDDGKEPKEENEDLGDGGENDGHTTTNFSKWTKEDTFTSLIAFFEASIRESLKPTNEDGRGIPTEIYETILNHVSDMETFNACLKVSRQIRSLCLRRPLIMENVIFVEPRTDSPGAVTKIADKLHEEPSFIAIEVSTGSQANIYQYRSHKSQNFTPCQFIVGSQRDRKTLIDSKLVFWGLDVPLPWEPEEDQAYHHRYHRRKSIEVADSRWAEALGMCHDDPLREDSKTRYMEQLWIEVTNTHSIESKPVTYRGAWDVPPNTRWILATREHWKRYKKPGQSFHYLAIRVKRYNKHRGWGTLWEEIIRETRECLESRDVSIVTRLHTQLMQTVGADDPFVLLNVGFEVRLFRWTADLNFGKERSTEGEKGQSSNPEKQLVELQPGQVYSRLDEEGQKAISEFLEVVAKHRDDKIKEYQDKLSTAPASGEIAKPEE